jgi:hypothetical protein
MSPGDLLRLAASGRREYARGVSGVTKHDLLAEADAYEAAARLVDGDLDVLKGILPSWMWDQIPYPAEIAELKDLELS